MYSGVGVVGGFGDSTGMWQWMGAPGDATLARYQQALNKELVARGFNKIGTDGQLGPGTCGAISWLGTLKDVNYSANPDLLLVSHLESPDGSNAGQTNPCKGFTYPTKTGGGVFKPPSTFSSQLPWCAYDSRTPEVQLNVNEQLVAHGYDPGPTDGQMCEETCGAMKLSSDAWGVDFMSAYGQNCQAFASPTKPVAAAPAPAPRPVTPSPVDTRPVVKTGSSQAWMVGGLVGAAVLTGLYVSTRKKH